MHQGRICLVICILFCLIGGLEAQKFVTDIVFDASYNDQPLSEVLVSVSKETSVNISFDPTKAPFQTKVNISVTQVTLGDFLDVILDQTNLEYKINGRQIIVVEKPPSIREFKIEYQELSGYIEDASSGERIAFAYLSTEDGSIAVSTNEYGYYNFQVPKGTETIKLSYLGYVDTVLHLSELTGNLNISMRSDTRLEEVVITDSKERKLVEDYDIFVSTEMDKVRKLESFAGEFDIIRYINIQPGVVSGADGLGGISVRGANADNNLILLDGIPVYNSMHALGVLSIFSQESIKSAKFYRSHLPAQYGGRLSSVLDIWTKEGSLTEYNGAISLGLLTAQAYLEGPIIKDRLSFSISGRRTIFEPYLGPVSETVKKSQDIIGSNDYKFGDYNAKIQLVLNPKNRIYFSHYGGFDDFEDISSRISSDEGKNYRSESNYDWRWGNQLSSLRWSSQMSEKVFSNVSLYRSSYNFDALNYSSNSVDSSDQVSFFQATGSLYNTSITDFGAKWDLDYFINSFHRARLGLSAVNHIFKPGLVSRNYSDHAFDFEAVKADLGNTLVSPARIANELEFYFEDQYTKGNTTFNMGIRASLINSKGTNYTNLQPRLSMKTLLIPKVYGKLSANITNQYLHLLASSGLGLPTDIWIPSTSDIKPQRAYQVSGGFDFLLSKRLFLTTEVYYKYLDNILNLKEGAVFSVIEDSNWENDIPVGQGYSVGFETALKGEIGMSSVNINYTWGHSLRKFDGINSGLWFYSRFDRRHQVKLNYLIQINKNFSFHANWIYATGHPQTLPTILFEGEFLYTEKNNQRLPDYHRLDLGFNIENDFSWGSQTIVLGAFNVYNKKNPYFYFLEFDEQNKLDFQTKQITIFPILPNISYTLRF